MLHEEKMHCWSAPPSVQVWISRRQKICFALSVKATVRLRFASLFQIALSVERPLICKFPPMALPLCFCKWQWCTSSNAMAKAMLTVLSLAALTITEHYLESQPQRTQRVVDLFIYLLYIMLLQHKSNNHVISFPAIYLCRHNRLFL